MDQTLLTSIENLWHSPNLPMWLTIAAAGFFAIVLLVTLFRAERSVANGALTVITLLAIGIAVTTMMRASGVIGGEGAGGDSHPVQSASLPALSCLDGLAGESVEAACEKALFASADSVAAGVSYTAAQISRLASYGNVAAANSVMTPELGALRRTIERDRYGLVAQVLTSREGCNLTSACPFFQSLTNSTQISSNMSEKLYDGLIGRYASSWGTNAITAAAAGTAAATGTVGALGTVPPPGKPVSGDFPSSASIPPVNIMTPEPASQGAQASRPTDAAAPSARPAATTARATPAGHTAAPTAPKKPAAPPKTRAQAPAPAPVPIAPAPQSDDN